MMAQDSRFFLVLGPSGRTRDKEGKTMKKLLKLLFVGVLMSAMAVLGLSSSTLAADPKTIKIGYTAPFTGAGAEYGTNGWRGIQLALEEVNKKGITIRGQQYKIEIIRYDSICRPWGPL
jgi:branched-chain amino acid transport system substrate-binding protein